LFLSATITTTMDFLKSLSLEDKNKATPPVPTATATTGVQGVPEHHHGHALLDKLTGQHQEAQIPAPHQEGLFEKVGTALGFGGTGPPPPSVVPAAPAEKEHHHHNPFHHHEEKEEHGMCFVLPPFRFLVPFCFSLSVII
jgi:hypothetical protein